MPSTAASYTGMGEIKASPIKVDYWMKESLVKTMNTLAKMTG
jgi:hypothetical protein